MFLKSLSVGPLGANCYIIGDQHTTEGAIIDPGGDQDIILQVVEESKLKIKFIIATHGHFDHIGAVKPLREALDCQFLIHEDDLFLVQRSFQSALNWGIQIEPAPDPDTYIDQDDILNLGRYELMIIHTPGHSPGGNCIYIASEKILFSGDTLFFSSVGRTDFEGGSMEELISSIKEKLLVLPDDTKVYAGHEQPTTIGYEKQHNYFLQQ